MSYYKSEEDAAMSADYYRDQYDEIHSENIKLRNALILIRDRTDDPGIIGLCNDYLGEIQPTSKQSN